MKNQSQKNDKKPNRVKSARMKKINLVFDEEKRRQFLGGFRKRKLERQKKAQEELQQQLKEEKKRIKKNAKDSYKKWISYRAVPEIEELLSKQEYEEEGHTVSILELKVSELDQQSSLIGENVVTYEDENGKKEESEIDDTVNNDEVPGMELVRKPPKKQKVEPVVPEKKPSNSSKNIKKVIKRNATKEVQKSKAFQQKQKQEHQKNKKKMRQKVKNQQKLKKKEGRSKRSA